MSDRPKCELCGEPMPEGEEMFKYHGYSGNCPKPPLPKGDTPRTDAATDFTAPEKLRDLCRQLERELIAACEERDRFRKDSEALDWLIANGYCPWGSDIDDHKDMPEHLRNRLDGKKT